MDTKNLNGQYLLKSIYVRAFRMKNQIQLRIYGTQL